MARRADHGDDPARPPGVREDGARRGLQWLPREAVAPRAGLACDGPRRAPVPSAPGRMAAADRLARRLPPRHPPSAPLRPSLATAWRLRAARRPTDPLERNADWRYVTEVSARLPQRRVDSATLR